MLQYVNCFYIHIVGEALLNPAWIHSCCPLPGTVGTDFTVFSIIIIDNNNKDDNDHRAGHGPNEGHRSKPIFFITTYTIFTEE